MKKIINLLIVILALVFSAYFVEIISKLDVLPDKYYKLFIIIISIINIINFLFLIFKNTILNIIGYILTIIIVSVCCFGIKHVTRITEFLNNSFDNNKVEVTSYNVIVLKANEYNTLEDIDRMTIGYRGSTSDIKNVKDKLFSELIEYTVPTTLYEDLLNKTIDAMIISDGFFQLLEDQYSDISSVTKSIYSYDIENEVDTDATEVSVLRPVNILISGSDSRSGYISTTTRSDVNMIVTLDPIDNKILLTSIPRDYYVQLHGTTGLKDKLTHSGIYGINMIKDTLEDLFGIEIDYTIKVGFQTVIDVVDLIGGIDIESDIEFYSLCGDGGAIRTNVVKGMNHFNGGQALSYARERYAYATGDNHRIQNQQQVLMAVVDKVITDKSILTKYDKLLESFSDLYRTDIPADYIKLLVKDQINDMKSWKIERQAVSGYGAFAETYTSSGAERWVMVPDMDSIEEATAKINSYFSED